MADAPWIAVNDYRSPGGWSHPEERDARARAYCDQLERGQILFFSEPPFDLPAADRDFLLSQQWAEMRLHKNVSYRPDDDSLRGGSGDAANVERLRAILRHYTAGVVDFAANFLAPYAGQWTVDFSSFRPFEEENRGLPLHKRNDLLHVDAFPSRPTAGGRILRIFTNLNPTKPRVWEAMGDFESLARAHASDAGLERFAETSSFSRKVQDWGGKLGIRGMGRTSYDMFMLRFHDYLKENREFQTRSAKVRLEFPPLSTWLVYTDGVAHAAMSGQYALEQTLLIRPQALVSPERAPYRILEKLAGATLVA
jgi:3-deoxy-D-manno-oct-2-ulosonic acid (Kdo) hydroxylase